MTNTKARSAGDFAAAHVRETRGPNKIRAAIAQIQKVGPEHWEYENDLTKAPYNIAQVDLSAFRDQFKDYWLETEVMSGVKSRRVWFGNPKVAAKFRQE